VGTQVTFTIRYGNNGKTQAPNVQIVDRVDGGCLTPSGFTRTIGKLDTGQTGEIVIAFRANAAGDCINTVTISVPNANSASDHVTIHVVPAAAPVVAIPLAIEPPPQPPGESLITAGQMSRTDVQLRL
jgi:uncharacterized repeat protein (TIGR01451 family)